MGHVDDRWWRPTRDDDGKVLVNGRGKPVMEKTELFGRGLRYRVRYIDPDGVERSKSFPDREKKRADDFLIEVESDKREGKYIDPRAARKTFRQQAESWYKAQSTDPATRETLRSRLHKQIYPALGNSTFDKIEKPATIRDWVGTLDEQGLSDNYKSVLFTMVSSVCDSAVDDRVIRVNPCKAKTVRRPIGKSPKVVVWPDDRLDAVISGLSERFKIAAMLGAGAGMRQGELLGFSAEDIDRDAQQLSIVRQLKTVKGATMFALPKGGKTRTVPLSGVLLEALDAHMKRFPPVAITLPWGKPDGESVTVNLVVTDKAGSLLSGDQFTKIAWKPAFGAVEPSFRGRPDGMHALRHLFASTLLARGCSVKELAEFLGHSDPGFTLRTYTHLVPSSYERARSALDEVLRRSTSDDGL
ncbi:tyrosine-type recombinase/integrase [Nocardia noduli]|uniref:tyrosine-type recombinase/integrase n=1 Tax=Nocardia noduli TaxID=2815722 RepID=UPI001C2217DC|nr:site-specific integrase [Nocardia noduli]